MQNRIWFQMTNKIWHAIKLQQPAETLKQMRMSCLNSIVRPRDTQLSETFTSVVFFRLSNTVKSTCKNEGKWNQQIIPRSQTDDWRTKRCSIEECKGIRDPEIIINLFINNIIFTVIIQLTMYCLFHVLI